MCYIICYISVRDLIMIYISLSFSLSEYLLEKQNYSPKNNQSNQPGICKIKLINNCVNYKNQTKNDIHSWTGSILGGRVKPFRGENKILNKKQLTITED